MVSAIAALLLIAYLPGALIFRFPAFSRERRAALAADERAFWAVVISAAWSLAVVLALAALEQYRFPRLLAINAIVAAGIALAGRRRLLYRGSAPWPRPAALVPL